MTDEVKAHATYDHSRSNPAAPPGAGPGPTGPAAKERVAADMSPQEREQPDPALQLSVGRVGAGAITLVAVVCAIIVGVVLWGLNSPAPNAKDVNTAASASTKPPGPGTSGAGTSNPLPSNHASGGKG
jgi:hypothetical protein